MKISIEAQGINQVQKNLKNLVIKITKAQNYFEQVGRYIQRQTQERFKQEQTPSGEKWKPLSEARIRQRLKRHKNGNMKILQDTGELRRSIQYEAQDESVTIGSNLKYAAIHQFGSKTKNIPARPYLGITEQNIDYIQKLLTMYLKRKGGA